MTLPSVSSVATSVPLGESGLSPEGVEAIVYGTARPAVSVASRERMRRCHEFLHRLVERRVAVYGLTTGCGPLASHAIDPTAREAFQRNLVRSHATTLGDPHPAAFVRAAIAVRAHVLARGASAVSPDTVDLLLSLLEHRIHPVVREIGGVGASGDLVELAQIGLVLLGEGTVEVEGRTLPAADALARAGLDPLVPSGREGLALINGTSFHTGVAALLVGEAERVAEAAEVAGALLFEALGGSVEALDADLHAARTQPGQSRVAERMRTRLEGSHLVRSAGGAADSQDAYTVRCIPQILGPVGEAIASARETVCRELDAVSDNPLFLHESERVIHGGNFHGQPVAMALDGLKTAVVEVGVLAERQLARLLDASLNGGLPPFLVAGEPGTESGFMGLQYTASAAVAENAILSAPASVRSVPTNANNQDVVSMGMVAARHAARVVANVRRILAVELLCLARALELRGLDRAAARTRRVHDEIRAMAAPLEGDRPLADDVARLDRWIDGRSTD